MNFKSKIVSGLFCVVLLLSSKNGLGESSERTWKVLYYADHQKGSSLVISAGSDQGIEEGYVLNVYRLKEDASTKEKIPVLTGSMKVINTSEHTSLAEVISQGSPLAKSLYPNYAEIMSGDIVVLPQYVARRQPELAPEVSLSYWSLFQDPKSQPETFELSAEGKALLREQAKRFAARRFSLLLIKGYTDHHGIPSENQIESYERAKTIRQFFIDDLGFDPERMVALGLGETELVDTTLVDGFEKNNRRIVLHTTTQDL